MALIRGAKRIKKTENEAKENAVIIALPCQPLRRDWWDVFSKRITGPLSESNGSCSFESVFKISRKTFNYICTLVKQEMMAKRLSFTDLNGNPLCLNDRIAIALRRLSSGDTLSAVGDFFGVDQWMVSRITWRFVVAMEEKGLCHLRWPETAAEFQQIKSGFEKIRGLPNCCGAIGTTGVVISSNRSSVGVWIDGDQNRSMTIQAIVDPAMRFRDIVAGWPGSLNKPTVLRSSGFFGLCKEGKRLNGPKIPLPEGGEIGEYIVGDSGFPLLPWLMTPYSGRALADHQADFNWRHLETQRVAKQALARLKERWKIIQGLTCRPDKARLPRIILICCILHNIAIDHEDDGWGSVLPDSGDQDMDFRQRFCSSPEKSGDVLREKLSLYLSGISASS